MIAFLVFLALMTALIVGGFCISMYLYVSNRTVYEVVSLRQSALIGRKLYKQRRDQVDMGMRECLWRVSGVTLGIGAVILFLIVVIFNVAY